MIDIFTLPIFEKRLKQYKKKNPLLKNDESNINDARLDKLIIECEIFFDNL